MPNFCHFHFEFISDCLLFFQLDIDTTVISNHRQFLFWLLLSSIPRFSPTLASRLIFTLKNKRNSLFILLVFCLQMWVKILTYRVAWNIRGFPFFCVSREQVLQIWILRLYHWKQIFADFGKFSLRLFNVRNLYAATRDVILSCHILLFCYAHVVSRRL